MTTIPTTTIITVPTTIPTTIITTIPTTIITTIPTTIIKTIPTIITTTVPTTTITTIPTTITTTVPTTTITTIPTTISTTYITTIPTTIITTIPTTILTTIPEKNYNICTYNYYLTYNCSFANLTNFGILNKLKDEMLRTYPQNGINVQIGALNGYAFQLSNSLSQLASNDNTFSNIDLGECESLIKRENNLPQNISLIFFKFENIASSKEEWDIQYEIYNPLTYEKLNLSVCENLKIKIEIPIELSDELIDLINNIIRTRLWPLWFKW